MQPANPTMTLAALTTFARPASLPGRYVMGELLAQGGQGAVYGGTDALTGAPLAIKLLAADDATSTARVNREVAALRLLDIPGVVQLLESGGDVAFPTIIGARYTVTTGTDVVGLVQASASRTSAVGGDDRVYEEWVLADHAVDSIQFQEKDKVLKNAYGPKVKLGAHPNRMPWSKDESGASGGPTTWTRATAGYGEEADFLNGVAAGLPKSGKAHYVEGFSVISIAGEDVPDVQEIADENHKYRGWCEVIKKDKQPIGYVYAEWTRKVKGIRTTRIWQLSIADPMNAGFTVDTGHPGVTKPADFTEWYSAAYEELSNRRKVQFAAGEARGHKSIKKVKTRP